MKGTLEEINTIIYNIEHIQIENWIYIYKRLKWEKRELKTTKREFLDLRVTNITSGGHKQKGLNLLLFFNFLTSAWSLASW